MTDSVETLDPDTTAATEARAFLEAAGVRGITIEGSGDDWAVAIGWNEDQRFVRAWSKRNPKTPNDPVYLAHKALATLIRNEGPCPFREPESVAPVTEETPPVNEISTVSHGTERESALDAGGDAEQDADALEVAGDGGFDGAGDADQPGVAPASEAPPDQPPELEPISHEANSGPAYPGIAILPDELGARRNAVLAAVTARKVMLQDVAADKSRLTFLAQAYSDYQNIVIPSRRLPTPQEEANARDYLAAKERREQIADTAAQIERAALDADMDGLERIAAGLQDALR